ncbi:hypothetical protein ACFL4I_00765 [Pseudomonadota bacterium]
MEPSVFKDKWALLEATMVKSAVIGREPKISIVIPSLKQRYAAALGISSILFFWPLVLSFGSVGVPIYFITSIFLICVTKFTRADMARFVGGVICLSFLLWVQKAQGVEFTTPLRSISSILFVSLIVACVYRWLIITIRAGPFPLFKIFSVLLLFQLVVMIFQLAAWYAGDYENQFAHYLLNIPRVSGIFSEPSQVAMSLSPFICLFICFRKLSTRWLGKIGLISLLAIFLLCPSTTMIGVIGLALIFKQIQSLKSIRQVIMSTFVFLAVGSLIAFSVINIPDVNIRIMALLNVISGSSEISENINMTSLVYIKGAEMAWASLLHYPLGVGLLNLQVLNDFSVVSSISEQMYNQNTMDGGSIAFKLIGEYGYIGLLIVILIFVTCMNSIRCSDFNNILFGIMLFGIIATFLRGASYFDGVPIIALTILFIKIRSYIIQKTHKGKVYSVAMSTSIRQA